MVAFDGCYGTRLLHQPPKVVQRADCFGGECLENKIDADDEQGDRVQVIGDERGTQSAGDRVETHADGQQEDGSHGVHASQCGNGSRSAERHVYVGNDVCCQAEHHVHQVRHSAVPRSHDF